MNIMTRCGHCQGANKWAEVKDGVFKIAEKMLGLDLARDSALNS